MATTDSRAAKATIPSTIDKVGIASCGDGGRLESENTTFTMTSHDDFVTGPDGDGGWNQSGMLQQVHNLTPDSVKSINKDSPYSDDAGWTPDSDWTPQSMLAEAARQERESGRCRPIKAEWDDDNHCWLMDDDCLGSQEAKSVSDYSTNSSSSEDPDDSLELSDSLASADELGSDESGRSRRLAKRRKLSSASTSYSPGRARQYETIDQALSSLKY